MQFLTHQVYNERPMEIDVDALRDWFEWEKRDFPWRNVPTPYQVWISEVMLQQTQASVVVPYFEKWMQKFPNVKSLAEASENEVIKSWEGLGYYARARNLHQAARQLVERHGGNLPETKEELLKIKGIGLYTVGAILSFAFKQKAPAVDGNVARVIARLFSIEEDILKPAIQSRIRQLVFDLLPDEAPWVIMEALIELGAKVCMKKPQCQHCPLARNCLAYHAGKAEELPKRGKKNEITHLIRFVPVIQSQNLYLVQKGKEGKVMSGLYEFPYIEGKKRISLRELNEKFGITLFSCKKLENVKHSFTSYRAHLYPFLFTTEFPLEIEDYEWISNERLSQLPFSSGHKRILQQVINENTAH